MRYELEWQYSDDPPPNRGHDAYIHFVFMLRFPDIPPGNDHAVHFCFNILRQPVTDETGIRIQRRGFLTCVPFSKPNVMQFVEAAVHDAFHGRSRDEALNLLDTKFIYEDRDFSGEFVGDLMEAGELLDLIKKAFDGVERGDGVTIHQATVIDDYGTEEEFVAARKLDTENRWQDVPDSALADNPHALTFLDAAGFRYYLPARMSWSIRNYEHDDNAFYTYLAVLPTISTRNVGQGLGAAFDLDAFIREHSFDAAQVNAIYRFICFMAIRAEFRLDEDQYAATKKWRQAARA